MVDHLDQHPEVPEMSQFTEPGGHSLELRPPDPWTALEVRPTTLPIPVEDGVILGCWNFLFLFAEHPNYFTLFFQA
jgi:hypothetical protein